MEIFSFYSGGSNSNTSDGRWNNRPERQSSLPPQQRPFPSRWDNLDDDRTGSSGWSGNNRWDNRPDANNRWRNEDYNKKEDWSVPLQRNERIEQ